MGRATPLVYSQTVKLMREEDLCSDDEIVLPHLRADSDGLPVLRLVRTERGLDFALPFGEVSSTRDSAVN